jgi:hypothetical protein
MVASNMGRDGPNGWPLAAICWGTFLASYHDLNYTLALRIFGQKPYKSALALLIGHFQHWEGWPQLMAIGNHVLESPYTWIFILYSLDL